MTTGKETQTAADSPSAEESKGRGMFKNVKSLVDDVLDRITWRSVVGVIVTIEVFTDDSSGHVIGLIENVVSVLAQGG